MTSKSAGGPSPFLLGLISDVRSKPANAGDAPRAREICVLVFEYYIISRRLCFVSILSFPHMYYGDCLRGIVHKKYVRFE